MTFTFSDDFSLEARTLLARRMSFEKLLYLFLLGSTGGLENKGESMGMGVLFNDGDIGGDVDIDEGQEEDGKNCEEVHDKGDNGVDEQVETESFLDLLMGMLLLH